ncbi:hypothetical protein LHYA1_G004638 [Lachnellula hyalina]|uniref:Uncharacterized protein n=1 Tax=Lachnellula hyalina TaxID=1316788 RepID=A0A8H8QZJ7_9HELO|nr:uncharacterized protein LHYA1_G004638 [Lachnellula hyalina]TVY25653.1 hypothetical protein LHYA1_G004638 [Lachnellula hyalina]
MLLLKSSGFLIHLPSSHSISTIKNTVDQSSIQAMPSAQDTMEPIPAKSIQVCNSQINKILSNTLYLTLNAPKVDEYHRGIFLTYAPLVGSSEPTTSGTLFHATYINSNWVLERRPVKDVSTSSSLVLLYRVATIDLEQDFNKISSVLEQIPLGKEKREKGLGKKTQGNPKLGGYDCVIWTGDALRALSDEGLIDLGGKDADAVMAEARALAGPEDAKAMVGKDFGGLTVIE